MARTTLSLLILLFAVNGMAGFVIGSKKVNNSSPGKGSDRSMKDGTMVTEGQLFRLPQRLSNGDEFNITITSYQSPQISFQLRNVNQTSVLQVEIDRENKIIKAINNKDETVEASYGDFIEESALDFTLKLKLEGSSIIADIGTSYLHEVELDNNAINSIVDFTFMPEQVKIKTFTYVFV